jgi:hypothetical protein
MAAPMIGSTELQLWGDLLAIPGGESRSVAGVVVHRRTEEVRQSGAVTKHDTFFTVGVAEGEQPLVGRSARGMARWLIENADALSSPQREETGQVEASNGQEGPCQHGYDHAEKMWSLRDFKATWKCRACGRKWRG